MTNTEQIKYMMMGMITQLPQEEQDEVAAALLELRGTMAIYGKAGVIALGLVSLEYADE